MKKNICKFETFDSKIIYKKKCNRKSIENSRDWTHFSVTVIEFKQRVLCGFEYLFFWKILNY